MAEPPMLGDKHHTWSTPKKLGYQYQLGPRSRFATNGCDVHARTVKTCTEAWESRNLSPDSQAMPDRHLNILNYLSQDIARIAVGHKPWEKHFRPHPGTGACIWL